MPSKKKPFQAADLSEDPFNRALAESQKRLEESTATTATEEPPPTAAPKRTASPRPPQKAPAAAPVRETPEVVELESRRAQPSKVAERPAKAPAPPAASSKPTKQPEKPPVASRPRLPAKRIEYERDDYDQVEDFLRALSRRSGSRLSFNILGRSLVRIAMRAESEIFAAIDRHGVEDRPSNNDAGALATYEDSWTELLDIALRQSPRAR